MSILSKIGEKHLLFFVNHIIDVWGKISESFILSKMKNKQANILHWKIDTKTSAYYNKLRYFN